MLKVNRRDYPKHLYGNGMTRPYGKVGIMFIRCRETKTMNLDSIIYWLAAKDCQILEFVGLNKIATDLGCYPLFQSRLAAELDLYYWMGALTGFGLISVVLSILSSILGFSKKKE